MIPRRTRHRMRVGWPELRAELVAAGGSVTREQRDALGFHGNTWRRARELGHVRVEMGDALVDGRVVRAAVRWVLAESEATA